MSGPEATGIGRTGAGRPCAWRRAFTAGLAVLCLGGLGPAATGPDPAFRYTVAGTGPLVLLESPHAGSPAAGTLAPGARGLVLTGRWAQGEAGDLWEVLSAGPNARPAWAAAVRLTPGASDPEPFALQCAGTEPFWGLRLTAGRARMSRPGQADSLLQAGARRGASGDPRVFVQRLAAQGRTSGQVVVIRRPEGCSDGMSDLSSPYETVLTMPSGEVLAGCCRRAGG